MSRTRDLDRAANIPHRLQMLHWAPGADREILVRRANLLAQVRAFFKIRQVLEVETPALSRAANPDPVLESIHSSSGNQDYFLQTSPEFAMKRLLASGSGDIFQICKVFRQGESGRYHNPEFTLLEWYRLGINYLALADEVVELILSVNDAASKLKVVSITYRELFNKFTAIDPHTVELQDLTRIVAERIPGSPQELRFNDCLDLLLSHCICPQLDAQQLTIVYDYPAGQAALARLNPDQKTAARFEIFWGGLELANGFQELLDPVEQKRRFLRDNRLRREQGLDEMPIDERFLAALDDGLPECSGVAMGLDRLLMRVTGLSHIDEVLTFNVSNS